VRSCLHGLETSAGYHRIDLVIGYVNRGGDGGLNFLHLIFASCARGVSKLICNARVTYFFFGGGRLYVCGRG